MRLEIYTDVSHNHHHKIGACGYLILIDNKEHKHEIYLIGDITSGEGELFAICLALNYILTLIEVVDIKEIIIKTDYKNLITEINFTKKKYIHFNHLKKQIEEKSIKFEIGYVKGHGQSKCNRKIDKTCRKFLRNHLKETGKDGLPIVIPLPGGKKMIL